ncbi:MAG: DNA methyltransferase [Anaerolineae bacterium]
MNDSHTRAPRNRTLNLSSADTSRLLPRLRHINDPVNLHECLDTTILGDAMQVLPYLPSNTVDLLILDPPYNLTTPFNGTVFSRLPTTQYEAWLRDWMQLCLGLLRPTATVYVCCEWQSSGMVQRVLEDHLTVRNRITWEREKGRGAQHNWKNCSEDIWFCTVSQDYWFDVEAVKIKRRVLAPYRDTNGQPKDWHYDSDGAFRLTYPSNLWTDISVPFWSMPENTVHPTQKPEKLMAKLILASSRPGDLVLDPFVGSGTTAVVAKKLSRHYIGIEKEEYYCLLVERRLELAEHDRSIQGYVAGNFWERNTLGSQTKEREDTFANAFQGQASLFGADNE